MDDDHSTRIKGGYGFLNDPLAVIRAFRVENMGQRKLVLKDAFFYLRSELGGDPADDEPYPLHVAVPNYYNRLQGCWADGKWFLGAYSEGENMQVQFWKDKGGGQHPDARVVMKEPVVLGPGEAYEGKEEDTVIIYAGKGQPDEEALKRKWGF